MSCISVNWDDIRDLGLAVNNLGIVISVRNGKEYLIKGTKIKLAFIKKDKRFLAGGIFLRRVYRVCSLM